MYRINKMRDKVHEKEQRIRRRGILCEKWDAYIFLKQNGWTTKHVIINYHMSL